MTSLRTRRYRLAVSFDCALEFQPILRRENECKTMIAHMFNNSGSLSSGSFVGQGIKMKLILMSGGGGGILFIRRYSISHMGIASSRSCTSCFVCATNPRYTVVKLGAASSEMSNIVLGGKE